MAKLTDVLFYHSGGGIYIYSARLNDDVWLATDFDNYGTFDIRYEDIDEDYESHKVDPTTELPTWLEVLASAQDEADDFPDYVLKNLLHHLWLNDTLTKRLGE